MRFALNLAGRLWPRLESGGASGGCHEPSRFLRRRSTSGPVSAAK